MFPFLYSIFTSLCLDRRSEDESKGDDDDRGGRWQRLRRQRWPHLPAFRGGRTCPGTGAQAGPPPGDATSPARDPDPKLPPGSGLGSGAAGSGTKTVVEDPESLCGLEAGRRASRSRLMQEETGKVAAAVGAAAVAVAKAGGFQNGGGGDVSVVVVAGSNSCERSRRNVPGTPFGKESHADLCHPRLVYSAL